MMTQSCCTHPLCARCCSPELLLDLLPNLLHRHLVLLDGSLGRVESTGGALHKEAHHNILRTNSGDSNKQ